MEENNGFLVIFGEQAILKLAFEEALSANTLQQIGIQSPDAVFAHNNLVYVANKDDLYFYSSLLRERGAIKSIGEGRVQKEWRKISETDRNRAAIGYDRTRGKMLFAAGSTIFVLNISNVALDSLAEDLSAEYTWSVLNTGQTFVRFYTKRNGDCVGITDTGEAYLMYGSSTSTLIRKSGTSTLAAEFNVVDMIYNSDAPVTFEIFDPYRNPNYPVRTITFPVQSSHKKFIVRKSEKLTSMAFKITCTGTYRISKLFIGMRSLDQD
jgi:hypothetical protein